MSTTRSGVEAGIRLLIADKTSVTWAGEGIKELLGYSADDLLSGKVLLADRIHSDDRDIAEELYSRDPTDTVRAVNLRLRHADGRIRCVKAQYSKEAGPSGVVLDLLLQDAKTLQRTMPDASMMVNFKAMMENTDDYIYFKDRNHVFTGASQTLVALCDPAEYWTDLLGQTDYDVFPEEYADIYYRLEKQVFAGVPVAHEIQETLTKDGRKGWVDNRKYPIRDDRGEIIGLYGIARDITARKQVEDALRQSEERLRLALDAAHQGWFDADLRTGNVGVSPEYARMIGYEPDEFQSNISNWLSHVHPEDRDALAKTFRACIEDGGPRTMEYRRQTKTGGWRWIQSIGKIVEWNSEHRATRMIGIHTDINERKLAEIELERHRHHLEELVNERTTALSLAKEAAEAANRAKSTFLANMSHELRTPMNAIMGMTAMALRHATDPKQVDRLAKVTQASQHLLGIINDILDLSRIEADRFRLAYSRFTPGEVLENMTSLVGNKATEKGLALNIDVAPEIVSLPVEGDSRCIGQILANLTTNAIKFTDHGSVTVRASLAEESPTDIQLRFEVRDTGIGIAADDQTRIFNTFEQADGSLTRKYGGTGLGLAICKRLALLMGGNIGVESAVGAGSTFWFTVRPRKIDRVLESAPGQASPSAREQIRARYSGTRILLVEDAPVNQELSRALLMNAGLQVDLAEDGAEAVEMAKRSDYALILMDVQMPKLNGIDATRAIRALPGRERTPILSLTANDFEEDLQRYLEAGMNDHIGKPVDQNLLYPVLLKWLERIGH